MTSAFISTHISTCVDYETFLVARELLDQARVYRITRADRKGQPVRVMSQAD